MKKHEDVFNDVIRRKNEYEENRSAKIKTAVKIGSVTGVCCIMVIAGLCFRHGVSIPIAPIDPSNEIISTVPTEQTVLFSPPQLSVWLQDTSVVWKKCQTKGGLQSEKIPLGTTKISDNLLELINDAENEETTVFAVMIDFSSCIDENELTSLKSDGVSLAELQLELADWLNKREIIGTCPSVDAYGNEETIYIYSNEYTPQITEISEKINKIKDSYYTKKLSDFESSFNDMQLGIYTDDSSQSCLVNNIFYTFATKAQLESFVCKSNEAFVFLPAEKFK